MEVEMTNNAKAVPTKALTEATFGSPFSERPGKDLAWRGLSYSVTMKGGQKKQILAGVSGAVKGGQLTCILGPSGAGKSSLLNVLAGRVNSGANSDLTGQVAINDNVVNPLKYRRQVAYVMQEDALYATLTPRETLRFSAALRIPSSVTPEQRERLVETMISELRLTKCADTMVGNELIKGISGGEKKRTSVGVELITNPSLLFLDEPTSGLDSFSATQCVDILRRVAHAGCAVLCTIHQPSSEILGMFDSCILMSSGHIVYNGPVVEINDKFSKAGYPVPVNFNPADHILSVVQINAVEDLQGKLFHALPEPEKLSNSFAEKEGVNFVPPSSVSTQLRWLMWREGIGMVRDKGALIGRFGITIFLYILYGLIFQDAGNRDDTKPDNLNGHFGALAMLIISAMFGSAQPTLLQFPFERPLFLREYSTGTYRAVTYFLSKIATELPLAFVQTVLGMLIAYFLIGLKGNFILLCIAFWLLGIVSSSVAMLVGSVLSNVKQASEASPALFVPQILFSGFFIRIQLVPGDHALHPISLQ